ncbi:RidA family protein [soil metagenome]
MRRFPLLLLCFSLPACGTLAQRATTTAPPKKAIVRTNEAPQPVGPYSQGVMANGFLFLAGQTGVNPQTRVLVQESMEAEARQVMENLRAVLQAAGLDFRHVVKTTIYLTDLDNFGLVNQVYGSFFSGDPPARETVQVVRLPGNARIEISMIAARE